MTPSSDPTGPSSRPSREPPTLDLTATVVGEDAREGDKVAQGQASETERAEEAQEAMLEGAPADDPAAPEGQGPGPEPTRLPDPVRRGAGFGRLAGAGLAGGLVGAGAMLAFQTWRPAALPNDPRVAALERRIATHDGLIVDIETAQNGLIEQVRAAQTLAQRTEEIVKRLPSTPANGEGLAALGSRLGAIETRLREEAQAAVGERQAIRQSAEGAARDLGRRLAEQDERIAALAREAATGGGEAVRAGSRLVLANHLDAALRDGLPYQDALAGLRRLGADPARLAALEPFAQSGAPTPAALAQSFRPLAQRIASETKPASTPAPSSGSWSDRILGLVGQVIGQVVTIRAVDAPRAPDAPGPAASPIAVEQALARGDFSATAASWDALPEPARQLSAEWGQRLKQRAAAEAASRALAVDAVAALNSSTR